MRGRVGVVAVAWVLASCGGGEMPQGTCESAPRAGRVYASVTDSAYEAGTLCSVDGARDCGYACDGYVGSVSGDMTFATHGDMLVGLNGGAASDNVTYFDVAADGAVSLRAQVSVRALDGETNATSDPRGYVALGERAYVARMLRTRLAIVDLSTSPPSARSGPDLAGLAEGAPQLGPYHMLAVSDLVWVSLLRADNGLQTFSHPGAIALVDPTTDAVVDADPARDGVQPIELLHGNPVGVLSPGACEQGTGSCVWVACAGSYFDDTDGALEVIEAVPPYAVRVAITESQLGGNIDAAVVLGPGRVLVRVVAREQQASRAIEWSRLLAVDFTTTPPTVSAPWLQVHEWTLTEPIVGHDGKVYVGDRGEYGTDRPRGVRVFDAATGAELTTTPIPVGTAGVIDAPYSLVEDPRAR